MVAGFKTRSDKVGDKVRDKVRSCSIHHGKVAKLQCRQDAGSTLNRSGPFGPRHGGHKGASSQLFRKALVAIWRARQQIRAHCVATSE
jgi:hypothetical protein